MAVEGGLIKYEPLLVRGPKLEPHKIQVLNYWRGVLYSCGLIGKDPDRYGDIAVGNVSQKVPPYGMPKNNSNFIISGTQTGGLERLTEEHYTKVLKSYPKENTVVYTGPEGSIEPSSEAMTHGAVYDCSKSSIFVFHGHSDVLWKCSKALEIPATRECVESGTPEMAEEVEILFRDTDVARKGIFSMGGHEGGIVTFGQSAKQAGGVMLAYLRDSNRLILEEELTARHS